MKSILLFLMIFSFVILSAQNLKNKSSKENYRIYSNNSMLTFIENKLHLKEHRISLKQVYKTESLLGEHISFQCFYNQIELKDIFIKVHINKYQEIFLLQENFSSILNFSYQEKEFDIEKIKRTILTENTISTEKIIYVLDESNSFQKVFVVNFFNEKNDVYIERTYSENSVFTDKDLKVYYAPNDTLIKGSVFLPDPLTSAAVEYGADYQDGLKKDTNVIILKTIANTGQTDITTGIVPFSMYGQTFNIENTTLTNNFSGSNVYYILTEIFIEGTIIKGYNTKLLDDISNLKTILVFEDYDFEALNNEQLDIEVQGDYSASKFQLKNDFFVIKDFSPPNTIPYTSATNNFSFNRSNNAFEDINVFYHLNNFHDYIVSLGFTNLNNDIIKFDTHGSNGADNSFFTYTPSPRLTFGEGGVDDGEDASVVIHEYTHALSHFAAPNTNDGAERMALDEALGDYFAGTYVSQYGDFTKGKVFPWDGHNEFWAGRITNSDSTYTTFDEANSIYKNAEIMSSAFMDIFDVLGREITDKLVLESMFLNVKNNTFIDVANNLLLVDSLLFNNKHKCTIYNLMVERGFLKGHCIVEVIQKDEGIYVLGSENFMNGTRNVQIYVLEDNYEKLDLWISNALGKIVYKVENYKKVKIDLNPNNFDRGLYYLRIQTTNNKYKIKLLRN